MSNVMPWPSRPQWPVHPGPEPIHPPGCRCGCDPCRCDDDCGPPWSADAIRCWTEMNQFKCMLREIIEQMGPLALQGVVDGRDACPGEVGEVLKLTATVPYTTAALNHSLALGVIPPGDWDVWFYASFPQAITAGTLNLAVPFPAWAPHGLHSFDSALLTALGSLPQQCNVSSPTVVSLLLTTTGATAAGDATISMTGRRMR